MQQHALDDAIGAFAVLDDLAEIADQHRQDFVDLGDGVAIERLERRRRRRFQLVEQLDRQAGEIVDEVQRVLDLVGDAGGELAERSHLLGLQQTGLCDLQVAQRRFGGVASGADFAEQPGILHGNDGLCGEALQ